MFARPGPRRPGPWQFPQFKAATKRFTVSGVTRNSSLQPLGNCRVHLFESQTDTEVAESVSDSNGNYSFSVGSNSGNFYVVAYKPGSPDIAGTTVNTLIAN